MYDVCFIKKFWGEGELWEIIRDFYTGCSSCVNNLITGKHATRGYKQITSVDNTKDTRMNAWVI